MTILDILALLLVLSVLFGFVNHHLLRLPHTIGVVVIALMASLGVLAFDIFWPAFQIGPNARAILKSIDFHDLLMEGFLSALLFAGAIHIDLSEIRQRKWAIALMASLGTLMSTGLIGSAIWAVSMSLGLDLPFLWALVFGALISPTDPVAVLSILKTVKIPALLRVKIAGESLFNDGVGVVVFTIIVALATGVGAQEGSDLSAYHVIWFFLIEALGGVLLGLIFGLVAFFMMRSLDEYNLEILMTLALVTAVYAMALHFHVSAPIAVVVAGILIGNHGAQFAMSEKTRTHLFEFWGLTDEILNSILFLLIGLEILVIGFHKDFLWLAFLAIPIVLAGRSISVALPIGLLSIREKFTPGTIPILTWGGVRGGISVALALSLPESEYKAPILAATYAVVVFSIIIQGLTMKPLLTHLLRDKNGKTSA